MAHRTLCFCQSGKKSVLRMRDLGSALAGRGSSVHIEYRISAFIAQ